MIETIKSIFIFAIMLSSIVFIHEFGHFIVAKLFNVYVYEFAIGMGPSIFQYKGKETVYSLRLLPLGGYCAMAGEDDKANVQEIEGTKKIEVPLERNLNHISSFKQILIMFAGPFMNFLLAWLLFIGIFNSLGYKVVYPKAIIESVVENSAADKAGILPGDIITEIKFLDGTTSQISTFYDVIEETAIHGEKDPMVCVIDRNGKTIEIEITPTYDENEKRYMMGITSTGATTEELKGLDVIKEANIEFKDNALMIFRVLKRLIRGKGLENLSGPVGIYNATNQVAAYGFTSLLSLVATLSLNVGMMNLLPVPLFDGGRIVIALIEGIIRRPLSEKVKGALMAASLILVLFLFVFVTYNDISRLFN